MKSYNIELNAISYAESDTNRRLERLYDAIETGKIGLDDLVDRIRDLRQRQEQLHAKRIEIENLMSDKKVESLDLETMLIPPDKVALGGDTVPRIVHHGGR